MADRYIDFSVLNTYQDRKVQTEKETQRYGLIDSVLHNSPKCKILSPSLKEHLKTVQGRTTQYAGLKEDVIATTSVESFDIPSHLSESEMVTLTSVSIYSGFRVYPGNFVNNVIDQKEYEMNKLDEVFSAMAVAKETQIANLLNTNKTQIWTGEAQVNNGDGTFTFDSGSDYLTINKAAQKDVMFSNLKTLFRINKKVGGYNIVVNEGGFNLAINEILKFGAANDENRQFQLNSLPLYYESLGIAPGSEQFIGYMMRDGAIGIVQNYPFDFRTRSDVGEKLWGVTDRPVPYLNAKLNAYHNKEAVDASTLGDTTTSLYMSTYEEWGFLDKFFLVSTYNSDLTSRANDIVKLIGQTT